MRLRLVAGCAATVSLLAGCFGQGGTDPPGDRFFYPTGIALTADGRYLLVANSNFDLRYNAGTVDVVDLQRAEDEIASCAGRCREPRDETPFLVPDSTVVIGSQVTDLVLSPDGARAYATVRGNASLTWFNVNEAAGSGERVLSCSDDVSPGARHCDSAHEVVRTNELWVPAEPYTLLADTDWVFTGHVDSGNVGVFDVSDGRAPRLVRVLSSFPEGVNGFGKQPGSTWYYVVSRLSATITPFNVAFYDPADVENGPAIYTAPTIRIGADSPGNDCRSIAFSPDGTRAYVADREPPSVVVLDTTLRPDGTPAGTNLATIELGQGPSKLLVLPLPDGGYLVLVVCFDAEEIFVVDPVQLAVTDVFKTGAGPHAIASNPATGRVYLANFGESTVWVLDFDPHSPNFAGPILSIGKPEIPGSGG